MANNLKDADAENLDKASEYFKLKKALTELRRDMKDFVVQHEDYEEMQKAAKAVKVLRDKIKENEDVKELSEKATEVKERMELLKEMIRIQLIENSEEEVEQDGKKLKLIYIVKEVKGDRE